MRVNELIDRVLEYGRGKPSGTARSLGMFFHTSQNKYFFDTGTGKAFCIDDGVEGCLRVLLYSSDRAEIEEAINGETIDLDGFLATIEREDLLKGVSGSSLCSRECLDAARDSIGSECLQLILELTGACNLRCSYCIYGSKIGFRQFNDKSMPKEVIERSIQYLADHGKQDVYVTFYGGEPLLRFDLMRYAIEYALERLRGRGVHFGFTTNLTLMTEEIASYLVRVPNLSVIFSIDGPEDVHDANRRQADGSGSFAQAMRGFSIFKRALDEFPSHSVSVNFNAVFMVPYDSSRLLKTTSFLDELCLIGEGSRYTISYPSPGSIPESLESYDVPDSTLWDVIAETALQCESLSDIKDKSIIDLLMTVHDRPLTEKAATTIPMNGCCVPGTRRLYVDTQGDLYACERVNKSPRLGNIYDGIDVDFVIEKYFVEYSDRSIGHCGDCWAAKMCPVCYANRMDENGLSPDAHIHCEEMKGLLIKQFSLYHEILEKTPEKLGVLNDFVTA